MTEDGVCAESEPGPLRLQVAPLVEVSFVSKAVTWIDCPWSVCVEEDERAIEMGPAEPQPSVKNAGSKLRKIRARVRFLLHRVGDAHKSETKFFAGTCFESRAKLRRRDDRKSTVDKRTP